VAERLLAERLLRVSFAIAFWLPLAACTWLALIPAPPEAVFRISDVLLHLAAFVYLTLAARFAFAAKPGWSIALWLLGYGALLEFVQGLGGVRVAEWRDLVVDGSGILIGLAVYGVIGTRTRQTFARVLDRLVR
jgi:VanZ family protein